MKVMEKEKVVLISGARKGIGRYLVEHYLSAGLLVEGCSRKGSDLQHRHYRHHTVDVTDENDVRRLINDIGEKYGKLDITINNAGIASMNHLMLTPLSISSRIIDTNLLGTFLMCRESAKLMKRNSWGRIVNFGSIAVPMCLDGEAVYGASKAAIVTFTKIIAKELSAYGITCNVVGPAPIETDLLRGVPKDKIAKIVQDLSIKRLGQFADVANVIDFFIKPESDYVTGQVIYLGGPG
jgi:3-oxoacyl-[acyl-carrier protein] reductase